ncbi:hypothetical protein [Xylophilus sp. ASV27]|nr:hypothetical protein [Xylophilus sp. ASV27]
MNKSNRLKYTCNGCEPAINVWGKLGLKILCGECGSEFEVS